MIAKNDSRMEPITLQYKYCVSVASNDELYSKMRRQLILREELRSKKRELEAIMKKDRNKKQYSRNQDNQSDTVSLNTDTFGWAYSRTVVHSVQHIFFLYLIRVQHFDRKNKFLLCMFVCVVVLTPATFIIWWRTKFKRSVCEFPKLVHVLCTFYHSAPFSL